MVKKSAKVKQVVGQLGTVLSDEVLAHMFKNANKLKMEAGAYFAAFIAVLAIMIAFAYGLFVYEPMQLVAKDGTTLWGVIVTRLVIFVPLVILAWFFGAETLKTKKRCEEFFVAAFVFKEMRGFVKTEDKGAFLMDMLEMFLGKK